MGIFLIGSDDEDRRGFNFATNVGNHVRFSVISPNHPHTASGWKLGQHAIRSIPSRLQLKYSVIRSLDLLSRQGMGRNLLQVPFDPLKTSHFRSVAACQSSSQRDSGESCNHQRRHANTAQAVSDLALVPMGERLRSAARDLGLTIRNDFIASPLRCLVRLSRGQLLRKKPLVLVVTTDPVPVERIFLKHRQRSIPGSDAHRPDLPTLLEAERRMPRISAP